MGSKLKNIIAAAAPIVGNLVAPGIGGVIGGAAGGALSGGGLKGALTGALTGAATGFAPQIGGVANSALGLGLESTGAINALGGAIGGGGAGLLSGKGLTGALTGAAGGYLGNGGFSDITGGLGVDGLLGSSAGSPVSDTIAGPTQGSGILGSVTRSLAGSGLTSGSGGGGSSYGSAATALLGGANSIYANEKAQKQLLKAGNNAIAQVQPYVNSGKASNDRLSELLGTGGDSSAADYGALAKPFTPGDLTQDPGYQFRLEQGTNALNQSLGARGGLFSGAALKAAQDYGQGLADQEYQDAYGRYVQDQNNLYSKFSDQAGAGARAAGVVGDIYGSIGNAKANSTIKTASDINQILAGLSGSGAKRPYNINGQIVYL